MSRASISQIKDRDKIGRVQLRNLLSNFRAAAFNSAISKIAEFYPVHSIPSASGKKFEFLDMALGNDVRLKSILSRRNGVYSFYDSMGQLIYVGKANRTKLYGEMKQAFNRIMPDNEIYLVRWPDKKRREVDFSHPRRISPINRSLHAVARYFSAYEISQDMIDSLEAFIIRMAPNNMINVRIEGHEMWPPSS